MRLWWLPMGRFCVVRCIAHLLRQCRLILPFLRLFSLACKYNPNKPLWVGAAFGFDYPTIRQIGLCHEHVVALYWRGAE